MLFDDEHGARTPSGGTGGVVRGGVAGPPRTSGGTRVPAGGFVLWGSGNAASFLRSAVRAAGRPLAGLALRSGGRGLEPAGYQAIVGGGPCLCATASYAWAAWPGLLPRSFFNSFVLLTRTSYAGSGVRSDGQAPAGHGGRPPAQLGTLGSAAVRGGARLIAVQLGTATRSTSAAAAPRRDRGAPRGPSATGPQGGRAVRRRPVLAAMRAPRRAVLVRRASTEVLRQRTNKRTPPGTATGPRLGSSRRVWAVGDGGQTARPEEARRPHRDGQAQPLPLPQRRLPVGSATEDYRVNYATTYGRLRRITEPTFGSHEWFNRHGLPPVLAQGEGSHAQRPTTRSSSVAGSSSI